MAQSDRWIGRAAVGVAALCAVTFSASAALLAFPRARTAVGLVPAGNVVAGDVLTVPSSVFERSDRTLVIVASDQCAASRRSLPLMARLLARARDTKGLGSALVLDDPRGVHTPGGESFAKALGLANTSFTAWPVASTPVKRVPTVVLTDRSGRVLRAWEPPLDEPTIMRAIDEFGAHR